MTETSVIIWFFLAMMMTGFGAVLLFAYRQNQQFQMYANEIKSREFHSEYNHNSMMVLERIMELERRITEKADDFYKFNHLVVAGQSERVPDSGDVQKNKFLSELNIDIEEIQEDPKFVFVLTPFLETEINVYATIVKSLSKFGVRVQRGDETNIQGEILPHIVKSILKAKLVIANIDGRNPNVMYELGIAHALDKNVILVSGIQDRKEIPFDIQSKRVLLYRSSFDLRRKLESNLIGNFFESS